MAEHTRREEKSKKTHRHQPLIDDISQERNTVKRGRGSAFDEKSSTMGRRDKSTGLSTKDGLTGSDFDGQLTD